MTSRPSGVIYLYGITSAPAAAPAPITGVDGLKSVAALECDGLVCWVSKVPPKDFADDLAKNMEDLDWLTEIGTRHQLAVSAIAESHDILPTRLGVVFLDESSLLANLKGRSAVLRDDLKRIKNTDEWGVKVFALPPPPVKLAAAKGTGKDYLIAKSALLRRRPPTGPDAEVMRLARALDRIAVATAEGGKVSGGRRDLQLHVSLLLKRGSRKKLETILKSFSKKWRGARRIECTGPWPPYSFVSRQSD